MCKVISQLTSRGFKLQQLRDSESNNYHFCSSPVGFFLAWYLLGANYSFCEDKWWKMMGTGLRITVVVWLGTLGRHGCSRCVILFQKTSNLRFSK